MKITSFYYLNYPDCSPKDPTNAWSEVRVEVGGENATADHFDCTYAFHVYTIDYLKKKIRMNDKGFLVDRSVIIVERFDDDHIKAALESILPTIAEYGTEV